MMHKKTIQLQTRAPAAIRLADASVAFTGGATNNEYAPVEASLLETLETELLRNEKTLVKKNSAAEADWVVNAKVSGYSLPPPAHRTESSGASTINYTHWIGSLNVAYQVIDKSGKIHDAQNISSTYDREFSSSGLTQVLKIPFGRRRDTSSTADPKGKEPRTAEDVKQILIRDAVGQIASNLGNTSKILEVQVATGEDHLNRAATFMEDRLWSRALDLLDSTPALASPPEEAYRQYDLGLVYEALSYDSKDAMDQRQNIYKAAEYYDKSLELNPKERYFVDSVARSKDAIARYKALDDEVAASKTSAKTAGAKIEKVAEKTTVSDPPPSAAPAPKVFTANDAIEMFTAQVPQEQIVDVIRNSAVQFDPHDKDTVMAMAKAKLPINIQNELRRKVGAAPLPASASGTHSAPAHRAAVTSQK